VFVGFGEFWDEVRTGKTAVDGRQEHFQSRKITCLTGCIGGEKRGAGKSRSFL